MYDDRALPHRKVVVDQRNVYKRSEGVMLELLNHFWLKNDIALMKRKFRGPVGENSAKLGATKRLITSKVIILVHERFANELLIKVNKSIIYV